MIIYVDIEGDLEGTNFMGGNSFGVVEGMKINTVTADGIMLVVHGTNTKTYESLSFKVGLRYSKKAVTKYKETSDGVMFWHKDSLRLVNEH